MIRRPIAAASAAAARHLSRPRTAALSLAQRQVAGTNTHFKPTIHLPTTSARYLSTSNQTPVEQRTSSDGVVGFPIDFDVAAKVEGNESQVRID